MQMDLKKCGPKKVSDKGRHNSRHVFDVLDGVNYLIDKFVGHARNNPFCVCESSLKG